MHFRFQNTIKHIHSFIFWTSFSTRGSQDSTGEYPSCQGARGGSTLVRWPAYGRASTGPTWDSNPQPSCYEATVPMIITHTYECQMGSHPHNPNLASLTVLLSLTHTSNDLMGGSFIYVCPDLTSPVRFLTISHRDRLDLGFQWVEGRHTHHHPIMPCFSSSEPSSLSFCSISSLSLSLSPWLALLHSQIGRAHV